MKQKENINYMKFNLVTAFWQNLLLETGEINVI